MIQQKFVSSRNNNQDDKIYQDKPELRFEGFKECWNDYYLEDCVYFLDKERKPLKESDRKNKKGEYPYYGASGIIDYIDEYIFDDELILMGEDGANIISRNSKLVFLAKGKFWVNNHAHVLKAKENFDSYFLTETLERINYEKYNTGTAQPKLNQEVCAKIKLKMPSFDEQKKIADFLSTIDNKIELLEKKHKNYINFKKYLMELIFTDKYLFNNDYEITTLGKITDISTGNKDVKDKKDDGKYPFFVRSEKIERIDSYSFDGEAILIPGDGKIGEIYHYINGKFDYHQRVYKISDFNQNVNGKYIFYYLQKNFLKQALRNTAKATVDSLRLNTLTDMKIELLSLEQQNKIADILSTTEEKINLTEKNLYNMKIFKKGLLQKMFV